MKTMIAAASIGSFGRVLLVTGLGLQYCVFENLCAQPAKSPAPGDAVPALKDQGRVNAGQLSKRDFQFVQQTTEAASEAIELGQLALQKSKAKPVQELARTLVENHQKELQDLQRLALQKGETISTNISPQVLELSQTLSRRGDFDAAYLEQVVKGHRQQEKLFRDAAANGEDPDVKRFANASLKLVEQHLARARELEASLSSPKSKTDQS